MKAGGGLLIAIERYLTRTGMSETVFGRRALNDPAFVRRLRAGSAPGAKTAARVEAFIRANPAPANPAPARRPPRPARDGERRAVHRLSALAGMDEEKRRRIDAERGSAMLRDRCLALIGRIREGGR